MCCRKRVSAVAPEGILILTWANHHYLDFAMNWVGHLQLMGVSAYLIGALDNQLLQVTRDPCPTEMHVKFNDDRHLLAS